MKDKEIDLRFSIIEKRLEILEHKRSKRKYMGKLLTLDFRDLTPCNHDGKEYFCPICSDKYKDKIKRIIEKELFLTKRDTPKSKEDK